MRRSLTTKMRLQIFTDAAGCCHLCGVKIGVGERWEVEHVIALSLGGEDRPENMKPAHVACHKVKSAKDAGDTARAIRRQAKHLGIKRPRTITAWRKFSGEIVRAPRERT
jgi:5-methylcytosine-specific restriction protein A